MIQVLTLLMVVQSCLGVQGQTNHFTHCTKVFVNGNDKPSIKKYPEITQVLQYSDISEAKNIELLVKDLACVSLEINPHGTLDVVNMSEILQLANAISVPKKDIIINIESDKQIQVDNSFHCMGYNVDIFNKGKKVEICSSDLSQTPINVAYYCIFPFCYPDHSFEGVSQGLAGYVFNIVKTKLNLDVQYVPTLGYSKSIDADGNVIGLVGMVSSRQAEFGIGGIVVTWERFQISDFNFNFYETKLGFCTQHPKKLDTLFKILHPMSKETWVGVIISFISVTSTFELLDRVLLDGQHSLFINLAFGVQILLSESHIGDKLFDTTKGFVSHHLLRWFWFPTGTILSMAYSSTLLTYMVLEDYASPLDTVEDILRAQVQVQVLEDSVFQVMLSTSPRPILQELYQKRIVEQNGIIKATEFYDEKWLRLQQEEDAVVACPDGNALAGNYHFSKETFFKGKTSHLIAKGSSFKQPVDWVLFHLVAGGLVDKYFMELVDMKRKDYGKTPISLINSERLPEPLEFRHFEGSLVLWLIFLLISLVTFMAEIAISTKTKQGKRIKD